MPFLPPEPSPIGDNLDKGDHAHLDTKAKTTEILVEGDEDDDGISDANEGVVCLPRVIYSDIIMTPFTNPCRSNSDSNVFF
ncbi:MAG: hypothetical protein QM485_10290 [Flavobacteriaceae bacterium]